MKSRAAISLVLLIAGSASAPAGDNRIFNRAALVEQLRHAEGLVESLYCEYEHKLLESSPEQAELIRRVHGKNAQRMIVTADLARARSANIKFWRKEVKQRQENTPIGAAGPGTPTLVTAYDGQTVRIVDRGGREGTMGTVRSSRKANWVNDCRVDPVVFTLCYYEIPYSQVIEEAKAFDVRTERRGDELLYHVTVTTGGRLEANYLDFVFDSHYRQRERSLRILFPNGKAILNHKYTFSDYRPYPTASGELAWFPNRVVYSTYSGYLPSGEHMEVMHEEITIHNLQLNIDIPDKLFELEIPRDAKIYDDVTGLGWLPPGERPAALFPAEARARRIWLTAAVVAGALVLVGAGLLYARRKRRRATLTT